MNSDITVKDSISNAKNRRRTNEKIATGCRSIIVTFSCLKKNENLFFTSFIYIHTHTRVPVIRSMNKFSKPIELISSLCLTILVTLQKCADTIVI